jgi:cyclophilin family peptidyl-prolyl cis-trans isomerase
MTRFRFGLLFLTLTFAGCDHHQSADRTRTESGSAAVAQNDSALTGEPVTYPRALPADLPAPKTASTPAPAPVPVAQTDSTPGTTVASDTAPTPSSPAPEPQPTSSPDSSTPASPTPDNSADTSQPAVTPPPPQVATTPPMQLDDLDAKKQVIVLGTSFGNIVIQLDDVAAPQTCGNFRKLVNDGFYNRTTFHRVIPDFIIQGGDPNSKSDDRTTYGQGDPGYTVPAEIHLKADIGAVAMARLPDKVNPNRDSNGSQFFICVAPCPSLDHQYTVFGHVIKGLDVAQKIATQPRDMRDNPTDRIEMEASLEPKIQALQEASADNNK